MWQDVRPQDSHNSVSITRFSEKLDASSHVIHQHKIVSMRHRSSHHKTCIHNRRSAKLLDTGSSHRLKHTKHIKHDQLKSCRYSDHRVETKWVTFKLPPATEFQGNNVTNLQSSDLNLDLKFEPFKFMN